MIISTNVLMLVTLGVAITLLTFFALGVIAKLVLKTDFLQNESIMPPITMTTTTTTLPIAMGVPTWFKIVTSILETITYIFDIFTMTLDILAVIIILTDRLVTILRFRMMRFIISTTTAAHGGCVVVLIVGIGERWLFLHGFLDCFFQLGCTRRRGDKHTYTDEQSTNSLHSLMFLWNGFLRDINDPIFWNGR